MIGVQAHAGDVERLTCAVILQRVGRNVVDLTGRFGHIGLGEGGKADPGLLPNLQLVDIACVHAGFDDKVVVVWHDVQDRLARADHATCRRDTQVFLLPGEGSTAPLLTGGLVVAMTNNTPAAQAAMAYLTTVTPHERWAARGYISPHQDVDLALYPNDGIRQMASVLAQAETIRFDGSDLMPAAVGTGTFWTGMVDYVSGTDVDTVLSTIEASWPEE